MTGLAEMPRSTIKRKGRLVALSLILALGLLALVVFWTGLTPARLWATLSRVPLWLLFFIAALHGAIIALAAQKWCLILRADGRPGLPLGEAVAATTLGTLAGQLLPIQLVTPAIRAWIARSHGISAPRALGTSLLEQVFEVIVLAAMALAGAVGPLLGLSLLPSLALSLLMAGGMTGAVRPALQLAHRLAAAVARYSQRVFATLASGFSEAARMPYRSLLHLTGLSVLRYGLLAGLNVTLLVFLAPTANPLLLLAAFPLVQFLTALPVVPAGLGLVEITWSGILISQGLSPSEAAAAALAVRLVSTFSFVLGAPLLLAPLLTGIGRARVAKDCHD